MCKTKTKKMQKKCKVRGVQKVQNEVQIKKRESANRVEIAEK